MRADLDMIAVGVADGGDGLPNRVSPSQAAAFQSCQLRYYFATVLGWREPASRASTAGVLVHDALEQLYRLPGPERTPPAADALLRERAVTHFAEPQYLPFRDDRELAAGAFRAVANIFTVEKPAEVEVETAGLEAEVSAVLDGVSFGGRIDRRTGGAVPRITDYKSGLRPQPAFLEDKLRQLYLYAAAELASGGEVAEVELLYLGGEGARVRRPVFPAVVADAAASLAAMRAASESALATSTFSARKTPLCRFCSFRRACPQFAASAPVPGSDDSNLNLAGTGLTRRRRFQPEPLEPLADLEEDSA